MRWGAPGSVQELKQQLERLVGLPWVNTVAADRNGGALYVDASVVPHQGADKFGGDCLLLAALLMFDGSRSSCAWGRDDDGTPDGIFGGANAPSMLRSDYVANSNDGYWITNARQPLVGPTPLGYSPLYGPVGVAQHLRTRSGFIGIEELLAQRGQVGPQDLQALMFSNRVLAAELVLPELLPACMAGADALLLSLAEACTAWRSGTARRSWIAAARCCSVSSGTARPSCRESGRWHSMWPIRCTRRAAWRRQQFRPCWRR
ncbi:penicillin acylase family protein [Massilia eburnea]|uniref:penicillin acylase family protein n=1 Tax=Massilia eburnea TaxID=1776165 RepID=UPI003D6A9D31